MRPNHHRSHRSTSPPAQESGTAVSHHTTLTPSWPIRSSKGSYSHLCYVEVWTLPGRIVRLLMTGRKKTFPGRCWLLFRFPTSGDYLIWLVLPLVLCPDLRFFTLFRSVSFERPFTLAFAGLRALLLLLCSVMLPCIIYSLLDYFLNIFTLPVGMPHCWGTSIHDRSVPGKPTNKPQTSKGNTDVILYPSIVFINSSTVKR